jgi:hypothetical protein
MTPALCVAEARKACRNSQGAALSLVRLTESPAHTKVPSAFGAEQLVFTQPLTYADHRAISLLVWAWLKMGERRPLQGIQREDTWFAPTHYVDITSTSHEAVSLPHPCQPGPGQIRGEYRDAGSNGHKQAEVISGMCRA